jgi:hypothetical protein
MPSDNFISDTVKAYLDANYKFDETEDEEVKPEQKIESVFGQVSVEEEINRLHTKVEKPAKSYEEFEDDDAPKYEKIRQNKKQQSVLDNY